MWGPFADDIQFAKVIPGCSSGLYARVLRLPGGPPSQETGGQRRTYGGEGGGRGRRRRDGRGEGRVENTGGGGGSVVERWGWGTRGPLSALDPSTNERGGIGQCTGRGWAGPQVQTQSHAVVRNNHSLVQQSGTGDEQSASGLSGRRRRVL